MKVELIVNHSCETRGIARWPWLNVMTLLLCVAAPTGAYGGDQTDVGSWRSQGKARPTTKRASHPGQGSGRFHKPGPKELTVAEHHFVRAHRMATAMLEKVGARSTLDHKDMAQTGLLALYTHADKHIAVLERTLDTTAVMVMVNAMQKYVRDNWSIVDVANHKDSDKPDQANGNKRISWATFFAFARARQRFVQREGAEPTTKQLMKECASNNKTQRFAKRKNALLAAEAVLTKDVPTKAQHAGDVDGRLATSPDNPGSLILDPHQVVMAQQLSQEVREALKTLTPREERAMTMEHLEGYDRNEIAAELSLKGQNRTSRVKEINDKAIRKLQRPTHSRNLIIFMEPD